jgi:hypothetical protein
MLQIALDAWPMLEPAAWLILYAVFVLLFLAGRSLLGALLRRALRGVSLTRWHRAACLLIGLAPVAVLGGLQAHFSGPRQLQSTMELFRLSILLAAALGSPYAVLWGFMSFCRRSGFYRPRFQRAFGLEP